MEFVDIQKVKIQRIGLGTWSLRGKKCTGAVLSALDMGYRHIDTAQMYRNEGAIGDALTESDITRDEIFLTTKIMQSNLHHDDLLRSFQSSLEQLKTDYADLLLIHWPNPNIPIQETIDAMNELQSKDQVKYIGVSNFSIQQLENAIKASHTPIITNQVRYDPFHDKENMLEYCVKNDIMLTAYSPLAKGRAAKNSILERIGKQHNKTGAQVTLRWLIQQNNVSAIPKSENKSHQRDNIDVFDFELSLEEMERIFELHGGVMDRMKSVIDL